MPRISFAVAAATVLLVGCGSSDESAAKSTVSNYFAGISQGNGAQACDQLTGAARRAVVSRMSDALPDVRIATCPRAIRILRENLGDDELVALRDPAITVKISGDRATASVKGASSDVRLMKVADQWLIDGGFGS